MPLDLALDALEQANSRDELLRALLRGAAFWLRDVQVFRTQAGLLRGFVALSHGRMDRKVIRGRALDIRASAAVEHALGRERGTVVVVREDDPIGHLANHRQLLLQPVCLDAPVCLVVGPPRDDRPGRRGQLVWAMDQLADRAAEGIHRVILQRRASAEPPAKPRELEIVALPPPRAPTHTPTRVRDRVAQIIPMPHRGDASGTPFRFPRPVRVGPSSLDNFYTGLDGTIHQAGIFVATHAPRRVGERVEVTFSLPELMGAQTIIGPVHWVQEHNPSDRHCEHSTPGMGVKLSAAELSPSVRAAIERFIRRRPPLLFE